GKMTYNRSAPRPRYGFILDDVPDLSTLRLPPTWATETSPGNHQVGYTCTDLLTPSQAKLLAQGAALRAGADPSGSDAEQVIRPPGTLNTKPKCAGRAGDPKQGREPEGWTVRLVFANGPRYTLEQLAEAFLPGGLAALGAARHRPPRTKSQDSTPVDTAFLARLPDGAFLMASPRYRTLFRTRRQLAQLARGEAVVLPTKYGLRGSGSEQVAVLIQNLLTVGRPGVDGNMVPGLGAPPEDEIRALALFWRQRLRPDDELAHYLADVEHLITMYRPAGYAPEPTRVTGESIPSYQELLPARKRGRPRGSRERTARALLAYSTALPLDKDGYADTTTAALARALKCSSAYVTDLLAELRAEGIVETRTKARGLALRVIPQKGAFLYDPHTKIEGAFLYEGHTSSVVLPIETRKEADGSQGSTRPAAPSPSSLSGKPDTYAAPSIHLGGLSSCDPLPSTPTLAFPAEGCGEHTAALGDARVAAAACDEVDGGGPAAPAVTTTPAVEADVLAPIDNLSLVEPDAVSRRPLSAIELCRHFEQVSLAEMQHSAARLEELRRTYVAAGMLPARLVDQAGGQEIALVGT
ncbi:MAG: hypothetical protein HGA45_40340, partial [Chloroflexales bacterium]|nr:hypothetical protein [Chloroflexales bacterium]